MILDSVQNDVVQVNRGSKEVLLEGEWSNSSIHGKLEAVEKRILPGGFSLSYHVICTNKSGSATTNMETKNWLHAIFVIFNRYLCTRT